MRELRRSLEEQSQQSTPAVSKRSGAIKLSALTRRKENTDMARQPMNTGRARSGGGYFGNKAVTKPVRAGPPRTNVVSKVAVSRLGSMIGNHTTETGGLPYKAEPLYPATKSQVPAGNMVAASTVKGPGGSRTIYRTGSQARHGSTVGPQRDVPDVPGMKPGKDILGAYGKDYRGGGR